MKDIHRCSGTNASPAEVCDSGYPQLCFLDIIEELFKKVCFLHLGHDQFPSWVIMETLIQILKYYGITPGIPQQLLEKDQQYPMQMKKKLCFPQAGVIQMLREWFSV